MSAWRINPHPEKLRVGQLVTTNFHIRETAVVRADAAWFIPVEGIDK